jgi:hypothetical protein
MVRDFEMKPGRTRGWTSTGRLFFDTQAFPVSYVPEAQVVNLTGQVITFPDYRKGDAYGYQIWDSGNADGDPRESGVGVITIGPQEWGPNGLTPPMTVELPDIVIGTVPTLCDHIWVEVNLTRTTAPSQINGLDIPVAFKEGTWVNADSGSLLVEYMYPTARMLQFFKSPTPNGDGTSNLIMRRRMSTVNSNQPFYSGSNVSNASGWTYGGPYGSRKGVPVFPKGTIGPQTDTTGIGYRLARGTSGATALLVDTSNYTSVYTGSIRITAGRASASIQYGGADPNGAYVQYLGFVRATGTLLTTWSTWSIPGVGIADVPIGEPHATRRVILGIAWENDSNAARDVSSVVINGITASLIIARQGTVASRRTYVGFYQALVPTGTDVPMTITTTGGVRPLQVECWAAYNLASVTPDATVSTSTTNTDFPMATASQQGFVLAISAFDVQYSFLVDGDTGTIEPDQLAIDGIDNYAWDSMGFGRTRGRAFQGTEGETLQASLRYLSSSGTPTVGNACFNLVAIAMH